MAALVLVAAVGIIVVKPVTTSLDQELLDQPSEIGGDASEEPAPSAEPSIVIMPVRFTVRAGVAVEQRREPGAGLR